MKPPTWFVMAVILLLVLVVVPFLIFGIGSGSAGAA